MCILGKLVRIRAQINTVMVFAVLQMIYKNHFLSYLVLGRSEFFRASGFGPFPEIVPTVPPGCT